MAQVNRAYEIGDQKPLEKIIAEFGRDPEAISGDDIASGIVQAIRRVAQMRRRLMNIQEQMDALQLTDTSRLKRNIEESEAIGGDPLGDLAKTLTQGVGRSNE